MSFLEDGRIAIIFHRMRPIQWECTSYKKRTTTTPLVTSTTKNHPPSMGPHQYRAFLFIWALSQPNRHCHRFRTLIIPHKKTKSPHLIRCRSACPTAEAVALRLSCDGANKNAETHRKYPYPLKFDIIDGCFLLDHHIYVRIDPEN